MCPVGVGLPARDRAGHCANRIAPALPADAVAVAVTRKAAEASARIVAAAAFITAGAVTAVA